MIFPPIFEICSTDSAVMAELGIDPVRLFPYGRAPQYPEKPYAVWQLIGGAPENYLDCPPDIDSFTIQVDVYADDDEAADAAAVALRDAIEPYAYIVNWRGDLRDPETNHYRKSFDVDWWKYR